MNLFSRSLFATLLALGTVCCVLHSPALASEPNSRSLASAVAAPVQGGWYCEWWVLVDGEPHKFGESGGWALAKFAKAGAGRDAATYVDERLSHFDPDRITTGTGTPFEWIW